MNSTTKIEKEEISNIEDILLLQSLECPIDSMIPLDPVMCSKCQTIFCRNCIDNWKSKSNACPMRCTPFDTISIEKTIIREQVNRIKVRCPYYSYGCPQKITIQEKLPHETICDYRLTSCLKCKENISIIFQVEHLQMFCKSNMVNCFLCDQLMNLGAIELHMTNCVFINKACEICYAIGHCNTDCDYSIIQCKKCSMIDIRMMIMNNKHQCLIMSNGNNNNTINEYHTQLIARYEYQILKKIMEKEEKMHSCLNKIKANADDIKSIIQKNHITIDNKINHIKENIIIKNEGLVNKINHSIMSLRNQIEKIQYETSKMNKEENRVSLLQNTLQSAFDNELKQKTMLKQKENEIQRLFLIQACHPPKEKTISEDAIKTLLQDMISSDKTAEIATTITTSNHVNHKEYIGKCNKCQLDKNDMKKCSHCTLLICIGCSSECKYNKHEKSKENKNLYCNDCFDHCIICNASFCNDCRRKCYSNTCTNVFCIDCYNKNQHQVRGETVSCKIFKCPACNENNLCIMCTKLYNENRICKICFDKKNFPTVIRK